MCLLQEMKIQFTSWLKSTSPYPSTKDRYRMILNHCKVQSMQLRDGVAIEHIDQVSSNHRFHMVCEKGSGYAISILDTIEVSIARAWYEAGSITEKHHHMIPTIEHLDIISGHCFVYLLDEDGKIVEEVHELKSKDRITIQPGVKHIVSFIEKTDLLATTIPKDQFNDG